MGLAACLVMKLSGNLRSAGRESLLLISSWFYKVIESGKVSRRDDKQCWNGIATLFREMLYLVWQLPKANGLLTELHMGDLSCPNLRCCRLNPAPLLQRWWMVTCLPLLMAISSEVGETLGSSEVPLPSSDSPSDPIRGCSCTTPIINRGVSFSKSSLDSGFAIKIISHKLTYIQKDNEIPQILT